MSYGLTEYCRAHRDSDWCQLPAGHDGPHVPVGRWDDVELVKRDGWLQPTDAPPSVATDRPLVAEIISAERTTTQSGLPQLALTFGVDGRRVRAWHRWEMKGWLRALLEAVYGQPLSSLVLHELGPQDLVGRLVAVTLYVDPESGWPRPASYAHVDQPLCPACGWHRYAWVDATLYYRWGQSPPQFVKRPGTKKCSRCGWHFDVEGTPA